MRGVLQPGDRIVESELANELQVSRGPIREAMRQLEQEGLITYSANKGCSVRVLSADDAWEIFFLRSGLEKMSLQLCGDKFPEQSLKNMELVLDEMIKAQEEKDPLKCVECDEQFHGEIVKACGMDKLFQLWDSLKGMNIALFLTKAKNAYNIKAQYDRHILVLEALKVNVGALGQSTIDTHYIDTGERISKSAPIQEQHTLRGVVK